MNAEQIKRVKIILDCVWKLRNSYYRANGMCPNTVVINFTLLEELKLAHETRVSAIINNEEAISIFDMKVMVDNSLCDDEVRVAHVVGVRFKA